MRTGGFIHTVNGIDSVPAMGGSHTRVRAAFENRCVEISVFLAFRAPKRRGSVEQTVVRQPG